MNAAIHVGSSRDTVAEMRAAINDILNSNAENETKRVALNVLSKGCSAEHTTITGCTFTIPQEQAKLKARGQ
jgi:hypothetical protein